MVKSRHGGMNGTPARAARRAFTLIEILIAVGAVALVSIGLAAIFDSVGKTVASGRRFSVMTQYAAQVENQLRRDIASMAPNSFLVVRQQRIDGATLAQGVSGAQSFRADEMLFFAEGDFASARPPVGAAEAPRSRAARIYYGQGVRLSRAGNPPEYFTPDVDFAGASTYLTNPPRLGDARNPHASQWTLLRHVTPLIQPRVTQAPQPDLTALGIPDTQADDRLVDSDAQIALQPAAASIFRHINRELPRTLSNAYLLWPQSAGGIPRPGFATGTVDIATTDLEEIRATVVGADLYPSQFQSQRVWPTQSYGFTYPGIDPPQNSSLDFQHAWMSDAFPTESQPAGVPSTQWGAQPEPGTGSRVRCEPQPVDLRAVLEGQPVGAGAPDTALQTAYKRADQMMLSAHNFMPRCSEFVVEWSFGRVNAAGQIVWHGPSRGTPAALGDDALALYGRGVSERETYVYTGVIPAQVIDDVITPGQEYVRVHAASDKLIYGKTPQDDDPCITSYFGYFDPTFDPGDPNAQGTGEHAADYKLAPWPRPKLVRITMTLCDARDPKVQEQFQFVLDVPQRPQP